MKGKLAPGTVGLLLALVTAAGAQEPADQAEQQNRLYVKLADVAALKSGAEIPVKALLFRNFELYRRTIHEKYKTSLDVLILTNIQSATCDTSFIDRFEWSGMWGHVVRWALPVPDDSAFLLAFYQERHEEPQRGEVCTISATAVPKGKRLTRKDCFILMKAEMSAIWPVRPGEYSVAVRTAHSDTQGGPFGRISAVRPPNFVTPEFRQQLRGEVAVTTCR